MNIERIIFWGLAVAILVAWYWAKRRNAKRARALVASGAKLVDVRSPDEYARGHLPEALNVPLAELGSRLGELGAKEQPLVVYCLSGARSAAAARQLRAAGFAQVLNLGAMRMW